MMRGSWKAARAAAVCWLLLTGSTRADDTATTVAFQDVSLANGLRVLTVEDHSSPIVAVQVWYHVGSKDEDPARQGFAHMFEHMMFKGTDHVGPSDHFDLIRRTGGWCNAHTNFDQTVYVQTLPSNQLDLALWLEAERMSHLKIDQTAFDTERKVVEEERRLGLNRPYGTAIDKVLPAIFAPHPYRWSPIGRIPDLRAASVAELREFWTRYYVPSNATLVVVGDIRHEQAQKAAETYFGWIPRGPEPPRISADLLPEPGSQTIVLNEANAPVPGVGLAFRVVPSSHSDFARLELLASILGQGSSSRLHRRLVADQRSAVLVQALSASLEQQGMFGVGAVLPPVVGRPDTVLEAIREELARLCAEPVSEAELEKARNLRLFQLVSTLPRVSEKAEQLGTAAVLEGDPGRINRRLDEIRAMSAADLQQAARTYLTPDRAITVRVNSNLLGSLLRRKNPEEDAPITAQPETTAPAPGRPGATRPAGFPTTPPVQPVHPIDPTPALVEKTLANGLRVVVLEDHEAPLVGVTLHVPYGAWSEQKPGTASMAARLIRFGTANRTEAELASEAETYAIQLGGSATADSTSVTLACLTEHLDRGLDLLGDIVLAPAFPADQLERVVSEARSELALESAEAADQADRELARRLFGDHPYARRNTGEAADLGALTPADLASWWRQHLRPDRATLYFAGDLTADRAFACAEAAFGRWSGSGEAPSQVGLPPLPQPVPTRIFLVDRPGVQSQIRVGQIAAPRNDRLYPISRVVTSYFGGDFTSRLNDAIRVKRGLTYGAHGGFIPERFHGKLVASTYSKTESTAETLSAVLDEIDRLRREPPSADEISGVQSALVGKLALERESSQTLVDKLIALSDSGLPPSALAELVRDVAAATPEQCLLYAQSHIDPKHMVIVVVGDASRIQADLEKIAPVELVPRAAR